jgi:hypothetical protein
MIRDHRAMITERHAIKKISRAMTAENEKTPTKEKDRDRPRQSKDQKEQKRDLIGKKSHHDGIIIEERNDPRETGKSRKRNR